MNTLWVAFGGAIGSVARYQVGLATARRWPGFPWGTLAVNVLGSLLLGIVLTLVLRDRLGETARVALGTGVLGGFTTYSSFNYETFSLVQAGDWGRAVLYVGVTLVGCLIAGGLGHLIARA
ncbi:MAG: fluoride efflux transporter CrcB [Kofleriaceae bacterium]